MNVQEAQSLLRTARTEIRNATADMAEATLTFGIAEADSEFAATAEGQVVLGTMTMVLAKLGTNSPLSLTLAAQMLESADRLLTLGNL